MHDAQTAATRKCTLHPVAFSRELWAAIEGDWLSLLEQLPDVSAFLSGPWMKSWLATFGEALRPEALIWRDENGRCVAACLVTIRRERRGPFAVRRAYLNATGEHRLASEHNQVLCLNGFEKSVHDDLVRHLRRRHSDSIVLPGYRADSLDGLRTAWPSGGSIDEASNDDRFVALDKLRKGGMSYLSALSRNTREKIRRSMRLYEEAFGPVSVTVAETSEQALETFTTLRSLHDARWIAQGLPGAFGTPESNVFHRSLIAEHAPANTSGLSVDMISVRYGEVVIGTLYNLRYFGRISFYQSGLRYTDDNRFKPGLVTHALAIQRYVDSGATEYDFLSGEQETARYKESLATETRALMWCEYGVPNAKMWLLNRLRALGRPPARPQSATSGTR